jgi:hypothetical protein
MGREELACLGDRLIEGRWLALQDDAAHYEQDEPSESEGTGHPPPLVCHGFSLVPLGGQLVTCVALS